MTDRPVAPSEDFSILVVCLGNVCRSPLAERLLQRRMDEHLDGEDAAVKVHSAGVRALVGHPMDSSAESELRRLGGDADGFVSRQLTPEHVSSADLVLTATRDLRSRVLDEAPRAMKRTFTIREFATLMSSAPFALQRGTNASDLVSQAASWRGSARLEDYDVADPIGRSPAFHHEVADLIDQECRVIAQALAGAIRSAKPREVP